MGAEVGAVREFLEGGVLGDVERGEGDGGGGGVVCREFSCCLVEKGVQPVCVGNDTVSVGAGKGQGLSGLDEDCG